MRPSISNFVIVACAVAIVLTIAALTGIAFFGDQPSVAAESYNWYFMPREDGLQPDATGEASFYKNYKAYYVGDSDKKIIYLTFDAGYENGNAEQILDVLKEEQVPAAFFLVGHYIKTNPEIVKRMVAEGHLVCNHTLDHADLSNIDFEGFKEQLQGMEKLYKELTGKEMPKYLRPPEGKFNETTLKYAEKLRYTTIFWSFAYKDWLNDAQPNPSSAVKTIISRTHPGEIALLHLNSKTNAQILKQVIEKWKEMGYTFASLDELPQQSGTKPSEEAPKNS